MEAGGMCPTPDEGGATPAAGKVVGNTAAIRVMHSRQHRAHERLKKATEDGTENQKENKEAKRLGLTTHSGAGE